MKIVELLVENYTEQLRSDLDNLIVAAKARGITNISTNELVAQMQKMGYDVNPNSLMTVISDNPSISTATPQDVQLVPPDDAGITGGTMQDTKSQVSQLARKEADRDLGS